MKVLLYEQWTGGHYLNYLNCLVPELAGLADTLVIGIAPTMRDTLGAASWAKHPNVSFHQVPANVNPGLGLRDRVTAAANFLTALDVVKPDFTLVPSADAQSLGLAVMAAIGRGPGRGHSPIEGTLHYGYGTAACSVKHRAKEFVYSQAYARLPFASVNFVNFAYFDYAVAKGMFGPQRCRFVGDPVPQPPRIGQAAARALLGLEPGGRYLGLLGSLDRRKAVPELLAAFRAARLSATDRLLLAGRLDPAYASLIASQYQDMVMDGRLVVLDRFLSDDELGHGYEALDLATVVYYGFPGLASLALKAAAAGTSLIAHDFGWLGAVTRRFQLGTATNVFDAVTFAAALSPALETGMDRSQSEPVRRLLEFHAESNFSAHMSRGLRRFMGEPADVPMEWETVLQSLPIERRYAA